jgi:hypothetical protein
VKLSRQQATAMQPGAAVAVLCKAAFTSPICACWYRVLLPLYHHTVRGYVLLLLTLHALPCLLLYAPCDLSLLLQCTR